jgi:hypothetical protein
MLKAGYAESGFRERRDVLQHLPPGLPGPLTHQTPDGISGSEGDTVVSCSVGGRRYRCGSKSQDLWAGMA